MSTREPSNTKPFGNETELNRLKVRDSVRVQTGIGACPPCDHVLRTLAGQPCLLARRAGSMTGSGAVRADCAISMKNQH